MNDQFFNFLILVGLAAAIFLLLRKNQDKGGEKLAVLSEKLANLANQNEKLREELDRKLSESYRISQDQFGKTTGFMSQINSQSQKMIAEVTEKLTKLDETNKQVVNFSAQLQNLQDILKNPKQRGILGEYYLEQTLKNVLPPNSYQMQYAFKNGEIVDAVVFVKDKIIPVDSKFSLENYEKILNAKDEDVREKLEKQFKQDLKNRIDETAKYVRTSEGTMEFAFMFIPSEAIYYDLLVNQVGAVKVNTRDLIEYAFKEKKVIIVSPTSFLAYLQTVLQGLRAMQIEENAKVIKANVEKLGKHLASYEEYLLKLGNSLSTTVNQYNLSYKEFGKVEKDVMRIGGGKGEVEIKQVEKPKI